MMYYPMPPHFLAGFRSNVQYIPVTPTQQRVFFRCFCSMHKFLRSAKSKQA